MEKIKIIYKEVGKKAKELEVKNDLNELQKLVEGYIQVVPYKDVLLVCNEEGKIRGLKPNINLGYDIIVGNCFIVGEKGEEFASVEENRINQFIDELNEKEIIEEEEEIE